MKNTFNMIPDDYLVPIDYPEGDIHLSALNNIQFAHSGKFDIYSMTFFSEATYLIANAIKLYRSGYYDCAFYSLRQSIELSIGILYLAERGEEYVRKWECQEKGFETSTMSNYLRKHTHIFSDIRTKMADFFDEIRTIQEEMNKYVHKQGFRTFYEFNRKIFQNEDIKRKWQSQRTNDFNRFVIKCIGAVAVYRLAIDPLPVLLAQEDMLYKVPGILTAPYSKEFISEYIGEKHIQKYFQTNIYQEYYNRLQSKESLCKGCYNLLHLNDYDRALYSEILGQFHVLPPHAQMAVLFFSISNKIANVICKNGTERYSSDVSTMRVPWSVVLGQGYYENLFKSEENLNQPYNNVYISRVRIHDEWEYIEHNKQLTSYEWNQITKISNLFEK